MEPFASFRSIGLHTSLAVAGIPPAGRNLPSLGCQPQVGARGRSISPGGPADLAEVMDDCDEDGNCTTGFIDKQDSFFLIVGYFAVAGLEAPVSPHAAILLDGRYTVAHAHIGSDFADNRNLDLSGGQYAAGVAIHF
jgi:hypothetical protein